MPTLSGTYEADPIDPYDLLPGERLRPPAPGALGAPDVEGCRPLPDRLDLRRMLTTPAPQYDLVLPGLPAKKVGMLCAQGGIGKSKLLLQWAVDVALGTTRSWPTGTIAAADPSCVMLLAGEDDEHDLHRRLEAIGRQLALGAAEKELLATNLDIRCLRRFHFIEGLLPGPLERLLVDVAAPLRPRLIIGDPLSRLASWTEVDSRQANRLVESLESVAEATGAAVVVAHHVSKSAIRNGELSEAQSARGSAALTDGVRMQCALVPLTEEMAESAGIRREDAPGWRRFVITKTNYASKGEPVWLRQHGDGGVFAPEQPPIEKLRDRTPGRRDDGFYLVEGGDDDAPF